MSKSLPQQTTFTSGATVRWFDADGNLVGPFAVLSLNEQEAAELWFALYMAFGNETALWVKFRAAVGEDRFQSVVDAGWRVRHESDQAMRARFSRWRFNNWQRTRWLVRRLTGINLPSPTARRIQEEWERSA